ncbi:MAG: antitoxin [Ignavibacteria bacterium GWF2_33_9]|nr:MAG: antitoxin [Ignavibacteria bacterium GWF2_33_9]
MDEQIITWLYDIKNSIKEIENYFLDQPKLFEDFKRDIKTKRAIERNLEIIGESVNRILKKDSTFIISNARKIIDTRNHISHGYDKVSDDVIWAIVMNYLPKLKIEIENLFMKFN